MLHGRTDHTRVVMTMLRESLSADLIVELPNAVRLQRLVQTLREYFHSGAVGLLRLDGDDSLRPVATVGLVHEALGRRFVIAQHPRLAAIMASREPTWFEPDSRLPDPYDGLLDTQVGEPLPVHDCMGVSLFVEGRPWGAITLDALHAGTFDSNAREQLKRCTLQIEAAVRVTRLEQENRSLRLSRNEPLAGLPSVEDGEILGQSPVLHQLLNELDVLADSDLPVLLLGETGVGKELFARRLHRLSRRSKKPLIQVNCAALPESLAESELFGHVKGAFSGASHDRAGRFDAAHGGTLFLDEVADLPLAMQVKLLRALQEKAVRPVGGQREEPVDVRILCATHKDLRAEVHAQRFRQDLFYRLNVIELRVAPLRERREDIELLANHILGRMPRRPGSARPRLHAQAIEVLKNYPFPGNVRELENLLERAYALCDGPLIEASDLYLPASPGPVELQGISLAHVNNLEEHLEHIERSLLLQALEETRWNRTAAARRLSLSFRSMRYRLKKLGLD